MTSQVDISNPRYTKKHVRFETSTQKDISFDCQMPRPSFNKLTTVPDINTQHYINNFNSQKVSYDVSKNIYLSGNAKEFVGPCKDLELSIYDEDKTNGFKESSDQYAREIWPAAPNKSVACPPIGNNWPNVNQQNQILKKVEINNNVNSIERMSKKGQDYQSFFINPGESPTSYINKIPQYKKMILPNVSTNFQRNVNSKTFRPKKQAVVCHSENMCSSHMKENILKPLDKMMVTGSGLYHRNDNFENVKCTPTPYHHHKNGGEKSEIYGNCFQEYCSPARIAMNENNCRNCRSSSPHHCCTERHESRQNNIDVEDLVQIIKIQNGQLQMLQEQVTKLMALNDKRNILTESQNSLQAGTAEILNKQSLLSSRVTEDNKMSIGVMTSFEMVRTYSSTIGQHDHGRNNVQCNKSQISITEVISATKQNDNFLEGLKPRNDNFQKPSNEKHGNKKVSEMNSTKVDCAQSNLANDLSLADIRIDDLKSPQLSPQASMRLDMQDFSDSDPDEQTAEGWTYYNKVMDRVNDILYTPTSSTSILRNQCSKTTTTVTKTTPKTFQKAFSSDISTLKRVTFNENIDVDPKPRPKICDTSIKMNELAKKYLQHYNERGCSIDPARPQDIVYNHSNSPRNAEKFLDLTALRQQPKLL